MFDYKKDMFNYIYDCIVNENYEGGKYELTQYDDQDKAIEDIYEKMLDDNTCHVEDSDFEAGQHIGENWGLFYEALTNFGYDSIESIKDPRFCDALIREFILRDVICEVIESLIDRRAVPENWFEEE